MTKCMSGMIFCLLLATPLWAAPVTGKVSVDGIGVADVRVSAWPLESVTFSGDAPHRSEPSDKEGLFTLDLPPGEYYFIASGKEIYSYYGRNPVMVDEEGVSELKITMPRRNPPVLQREPQVDTGVLGKMTFKGKAIEGVIVTVYPDLNSQLKGMGLGWTAPSDQDGYIEVPLQAGTYYLVARKRTSGSFSGPLKAGDYFGYFSGNPLKIKDGEVAKVGIDMVEVPDKVEHLADKLFGKTSIRGKVLNMVGAPVAGVRVLLYADSSMLNRPLYVSQPSAKNGEYVLSFPNGGTYYLVARNKLGGAPAPGELYGRYAKTIDSSIQIKSGEALKEIDLLVQEMW